MSHQDGHAWLRVMKEGLFWMTLNTAVAWSFVIGKGWLRSSVFWVFIGCTILNIWCIILYLWTRKRIKDRDKQQAS